VIQLAETRVYEKQDAERSDEKRLGQERKKRTRLKKTETPKNKRRSVKKEEGRLHACSRGAVRPECDTAEERQADENG